MPVVFYPILFATLISGGFLIARWPLIPFVGRSIFGAMTTMGVLLLFNQMLA